MGISIPLCDFSEGFYSASFLEISGFFTWLGVINRIEVNVSGV